MQVAHVVGEAAFQVVNFCFHIVNVGLRGVAAQIGFVAQIVVIAAGGNGGQVGGSDKARNKVGHRELNRLAVFERQSHFLCLVVVRAANNHCLQRQVDGLRHRYGGVAFFDGGGYLVSVRVEFKADCVGNGRFPIQIVIITTEGDGGQIGGVGLGFEGFLKPADFVNVVGVLRVGLELEVGGVGLAVERFFDDLVLNGVLRFVADCVINGHGDAVQRFGQTFD